MKSEKESSSTEGIAVEEGADFTGMTSSFAEEGFKLTRVKRIVYPPRMRPATVEVNGG